MTTVIYTCDTRRDTARHLADQGKSLRAIAAQLGCSKDTVRRELALVAPGDETDATQASIVIPGAHPCAVEAVEALRDIDPETLRDSTRQQCDATRGYLLAAVRLAAVLLPETGPLDVLDRLSLHRLADRLHAIADAD
jgi:hypothetical protein